MPHLRGPQHPRTHLTWPDVLALRASHAHGTGLRALSRAYHLDPHTVFDIVHHLSWWPEPPSSKEQT